MALRRQANGSSDGRLIRISSSEYLPTDGRLRSITYIPIKEPMEVKHEHCRVVGEGIDAAVGAGLTMKLGPKLTQTLCQARITVRSIL